MSTKPSAIQGVDAVAGKIAEQFQVTGAIKSSRLAEIIERHQHNGFFGGEALFQACHERFLRMNAFKEEYCNFLYSDEVQILFDEELGDFPPDANEKLNKEQERLRLKFDLPTDVYLTIDPPVRENNLPWWINTMCAWVAGTLEENESAAFVSKLDFQEFDEYFILLGVPNFAISGEQRNLIERALVEIGCGLDNEFQNLIPICQGLRQLDER